MCQRTAARSYAAKACTAEPTRSFPARFSYFKISLYWREVQQPLRDACAPQLPNPVVTPLLQILTLRLPVNTKK